MIGRGDIDAVIFDCDGVLVDSEALAIRGERGALEALGLFYSAEDYVRRFVGMHDHAFFDALREDWRARLGGAAPDDFEDLVLAGRAAHRELLVAIDGAREAMEAARAAFGALAVASSSRAHFLKSKLERTGLYDLAAPHVYSADLVAHGKPAPDIFLYAAERIGADPARCLVIEDSANGVRAGRAAGMRVVGFIGGTHCFAGYAAHLEGAGAHAVAMSFADVRALFGRISR